MFSVQRYKLFENSKDFESLFMKSHSDILKTCNLSVKDFKINHIDPAINNKTILIAYEDEKPIGYQSINIKNRVLNSSFTFIDPKYRRKGYGNLLRLKTFEMFKNKFDKVQAAIFKGNISSLISCQKLAKLLNLNLKEEKIITDENHNYIAKIFNVSLNE